MKIINYKKRKRKRKDVKERKEANKAVDISSIKLTWNQFCKDNFMKKGIENIVLNINKIAFLSYKLMDFHVVRSAMRECVNTGIDKSIKRGSRDYKTSTA